MATSLHGNAFRIIGFPSRRDGNLRSFEFSGVLLLLLLSFLASLLELTTEQTVALSVIRDALTPMWRQCNDATGCNVGRPGESNPWWRHQMVIFSALLVICAGNSPVPVDSPYKGQWRGALMFPLICVWINGWENNREAGDLRRYRAHYDVIVMPRE